MAELNAAIYIMCAFPTLLLLILGLKGTLTPDSMKELWGFDYNDAGGRGDYVGKSTIRSYTAGLFLGTAAIYIVGFATGEAQYFMAAACTLGAFALGRVVGVVVDGGDKRSAVPLIVEAVFCALSVTSYVIAVNQDE